MAKLSVFSGTKTSDSESHADSGGHSMAVTESANGLLSEERFRQMLCRERKRSERSRKHLLLMLIDEKGAIPVKGEAHVFTASRGLPERNHSRDGPVGLV